MTALLPVERHAVLLLVATLEDVGKVMDTEVATADKVNEVDVVVAAVGEAEEMERDMLDENSPPRRERNRAPHRWKSLRCVQRVRLEHRPHRAHHRHLWGVGTQGVQHITLPDACNDSCLGERR